ncbi:MAG: succinate dehydrogenase iron-sulfur subunit [Chloroflexi bacterium]|nr:succinate dehydrogenase iron-sulfur subunit [Chloroflexota bacterium]
MAETATLHIFRFDPEKDKSPYFKTYDVAITAKMNVLEALLDIVDKQDGSLSLRYACRGAICGSCAMYINGSYRLACQTMIANLNPSDITVGPLPHLPNIKDLVVDMTPFFEKYERIVPYLIRNSAPLEKEIPQNLKQRKAIDEMIDCILCGCCYSSCPMVWTHRNFLGPAALTKANRFVQDSRDEGLDQRLSIVAGEDGIWRCHTIFNCADACPKKINTTASIQDLKRKTIARRLHLA